MRHVRSVTAGVVFATAGLLGLAGCGTGEPARQVAVEVAAALTPEEQALAALGIAPDGGDPAGGDLTTGGVPADPAAASAAPAPDKEAAGPGERRRHPHRARVLLRRDTLHGEVVVQGRDGTRTLVVQRGTVTAVDGGSMTVRSADGFTATWTFAEKLRVVERRATVQPDQVEVGDVLGVAGAKDGERSLARLIVIPVPR